MAKLKIKEGALQAEVVQVEKVEAPHVKENNTPICDLTNVNEELDALRLEIIALNSQHEHDITALSKKLEKVERPIVKNITMDATDSADLDALERTIVKTIDKLNSDRKEESEAIEKALKDSNKLQSAINFITIMAIMAIVFLK